MPKIPTFQAQTSNTPRLSPSAAAAPSMALARGGEQISNTANYASRVIDYVQTKEQEAIRTVKAAQIERGLRADAEDLAASYEYRTDYDKFDADLETALKGMEEKWQASVGEDPKLQAIFQIELSDVHADLAKTVRAKRRNVLVKQGEGEWQAGINQTLKDYASSDDPNEREILRNELEIFGNLLVKSRLITPERVVDDLAKFDNDSEDVRVDRDIELDPKEAEKKLKAGEYDLDPKLTQDKIEKAKQKQDELETEERVKKNEAEKIAKKEKEKIHATGELELSNILYINKDASGAYEYLKGLVNKEILEGDEVSKWYKEIEKMSKGEGGTDPFKKSDPKYADKIFKEAMEGLIDPTTLRPLPNKLSREDYRLVKGIAELAIKSEKKYIADLTKSVLDEARRRIMGSNFMYIGAEDEAQKQAGIATRFILNKLIEAETDKEKLELLDQNSKNFVLNQALQGKPLIDRDSGEPDFSSLWSKPGAVKTPTGSKPVKHLWGEK